MRPGHAGDDCRHVKIDLISVSVVSDWWAVCAGINALITAYRRNDRECPTQTSGKHPVMRLAALPPPLDEHGSSPLLSRKRDVDTAWSKRQPHSLSRRDAIDDNHSDCGGSLPILLRQELHLRRWIHNCR